jgi:hypothetical protein
MLKLYWRTFRVFQFMWKNRAILERGHKAYTTNMPHDMIEQIGEDRYGGVALLDSLYRFYFATSTEELRKDMTELDTILD